jgi:hypothetical protein
VAFETSKMYSFCPTFSQENASNEPNLDETICGVEPKQPIQVTANSGTPSGLDNAAVQLMWHSRPRLCGQVKATFQERMKLYVWAEL